MSTSKSLVYEVFFHVQINKNYFFVVVFNTFFQISNLRLEEYFPCLPLLKLTQWPYSELMCTMSLRTTVTSYSSERFQYENKK